MDEVDDTVVRIDPPQRIVAGIPSGGCGGVANGKPAPSG
jgi:hypothetical protein